jgi:hypothetical protein
MNDKKLITVKAEEPVVSYKQLQNETVLERI